VPVLVFGAGYDYFPAGGSSGTALWSLFGLHSVPGLGEPMVDVGVGVIVASHLVSSDVCARQRRPS
jgi:hypothetical protein